MLVRALIRRILASLGYRLQKVSDADFEPAFLSIHTKVKAYTMTSIERQYALYKATQHITDTGIEGDIVECGVWKGGSSMIAALALLERQDTSRTLYLYDTFAGMSEPTENDVNVHGTRAKDKWGSLNKDGINLWDYASLEEVQQNLASTEYPKEKIVCVPGKVEDTIPATVPQQIALLRLDTDWYASTRHELEHLFPRMSKGGVLIIDDYGHWEGARKAVDEYVQAHDLKLFLQRIDYTGRMAVV